VTRRMRWKSLTVIVNDSYSKDLVWKKNQGTGGNALECMLEVRRVVEEAERLCGGFGQFAPPLVTRPPTLGDVLVPSLLATSALTIIYLLLLFHQADHEPSQITVSKHLRLSNSARVHQQLSCRSKEMDWSRLSRHPKERRHGSLKENPSSGVRQIGTKRGRVRGTPTNFPTIIPAR